jgi:hypothetical protein
MPRGIPKDPNHPRNKKRNAAAAAAPNAAPKKRGRPPKNAKSVEVSSSAIKNSDPVKMVEGIWYRSDNEIAHLDQVRQNLVALAAIAGSSNLDLVREEITAQTKQLGVLTNKLINGVQDVVVAKAVDADPVKPTAPAPVVQQAAPTQQVAPLPSPPSFAPPPFPPAVSQ